MIRLMMLMMKSLLMQSLSINMSRVGKQIMMMVCKAVYVVVGKTGNRKEKDKQNEREGLFHECIE